MINSQKYLTKLERKRGKEESNKNRVSYFQKKGKPDPFNKGVFIRKRKKIK